MATLTFHANNLTAKGSVATQYDDDPSLIGHTQGSGIGFFGGGFGISVPVGQYQDSSYVTNGAGTSSGVKLNNSKYTATSGITHNGTAVTDNTSGIPNWYAPLNIRFVHDEAVATQNCKLRIFDRNDISKHASGVSTQVCEIRHPHPLETHSFSPGSETVPAAGSGSLAHRGLGSDYSWQEYDPTVGGVPVDMLFTSSPGMSGLNTVAGEPLPSANYAGPGADNYFNWLTNEGPGHRSTRHDWYINLSASPQSIGSKTDFGLYFTLEYL